jgi:hypothetical protein
VRSNTSGSTRALQNPVLMSSRKCRASGARFAEAVGRARFSSSESWFTNNIFMIRVFAGSTLSIMSSYACAQELHAARVYCQDAPEENPEPPAGELAEHHHVGGAPIVQVSIRISCPNSQKGSLLLNDVGSYSKGLACDKKSRCSSKCRPDRSDLVVKFGKHAR